MLSFKRAVKGIRPVQLRHTAFSLSKQNMEVLNIIKQQIVTGLKHVKKREVRSNQKQGLLDETLKEGRYFDLKIVDEIKKKYKKTVVFNFQDSIHITLSFHFLSNSRRHNLDKYKNIMVSWLLLLKTYETPHCVESVDVDVYLTRFEKVLNHSQEGDRTGNAVPLGGYNVNTGFTWRCGDYTKGRGKIVLYREEDFLKVFFHETMHLFNMEFHDTGKHSAREIIKLTSDVNLFESYCEAWARIINVIYYSIFNPKKNLQSLIITEGLFSFFQARKVLEYYNLTIQDIHNDKEKVTRLFIESSNVYSYYVVTAMLLTHPDNYLTFCRTFNVNTLKFNKNHVTKYINLLKSILKSENMILIDNQVYGDYDTTNDASLKMTYYDNN